MNQEQAKAWLPLIQAVAEGKTIQSVSYSGKFDERTQTAKMFPHWENCYLPVNFEGRDPTCYRIKPEPKKEWIRVGLWTAENAMPRCYANNIVPESQFEGRKYFGGWLTDRIEYTLPEEN